MPSEKDMDEMDAWLRERNLHSGVMDPETELQLRVTQGDPNAAADLAYVKGKRDVVAACVKRRME